MATWYILARVSLSKKLQDGIRAYQSGKGRGPVKEALGLFLTVLGVEERPTGDLGVTLKITSDWFYALGKIQQGRVVKVLRLVRDLIRWMDDTPDARTLEQLEGLIPEFQWLEGRVREETDEIPHGPFILVQMPGVSRKAMGEAVAALDDATKFLQRKFPQVVYGKVFVSPRVSGGVAQYVPEGDKVYLSLQAKETVGDVHSICHEFGHRYFHRFWRDKEARQMFWRLSEDPVYEKVIYTPTRKKELAGELLEQVHDRKAGRNPEPPSEGLSFYLTQIIKSPGKHDLWAASQAALKGGDREEIALVDTLVQLGPDEVQLPKVLRPALAVTPYAAQKGWTENFAEAFAFYVMGKPLPPEIKAIMDGLS